MFQIITNSYKFGFGGKEKSNEVYGEGNSYDYGARMYDPRISRWWAVDIVKQPSLSPYNAFANCPILYRDPDGKTQVVGTDGSIMFDDGKNDGNVYVYSGGQQLNFTHFSAEEMQKLGGKNVFTQITSGRIQDGKVYVKIVCTEDQLVHYVNSIKEHAEIDDNFKNNHNFKIAPENIGKGALETSNMEATHYGVAVKDPDNTEFELHYAPDYSTSNWMYGNVYDTASSTIFL
jgi:RHS repeat-associated protein